MNDSTGEKDIQRYALFVTSSTRNRRQLFWDDKDRSATVRTGAVVIPAGQAQYSRKIDFKTTRKPSR